MLNNAIKQQLPGRRRLIRRPAIRNSSGLVPGFRDRALFAKARRFAKHAAEQYARCTWLITKREQIVNPTPRRADRSTVARLDLIKPTRKRGARGRRGAVFAPGRGDPRVRTCPRTRLASTGTRLPGVARRSRWTVGVTMRCVDRTRTRVPAGRGGRSHPPRHRVRRVAVDRGARSLPSVVGIQSESVGAPRSRKLNGGFNGFL
jgi:hypothetical protein